MSCAAAASSAMAMPDSGISALSWASVVTFRSSCFSISHISEASSRFDASPICASNSSSLAYPSSVTLPGVILVHDALLLDLLEDRKHVLHEIVGRDSSR